MHTITTSLFRGSFWITNFKSVYIGVFFFAILSLRRILVKSSSSSRSTSLCFTTMLEPCLYLILFRFLDVMCPLGSFILYVLFLVLSSMTPPSSHDPVSGFWIQIGSPGFRALKLLEFLSYLAFCFSSSFDFSILTFSTCWLVPKASVKVGNNVLMDLPNTTWHGDEPSARGVFLIWDIPSKNSWEWTSFSVFFNRSLIILTFLSACPLLWGL